MNSILPRLNPAIFFASAALVTLGGCTVYEPAPRREVVYVSQAPTIEVERGNTVYIESVNDFEAPLNPYGEWVVVESYGRCWRPSRVASGWRPYSNGQWVHSDAGWCWQSEEPWGWATYHYGRWDFHGSFGWIWVPETRWAPAWVEWRSGGGYIGWAPLPPANRPRFVIESHRSENVYVFVAEGRFVEPVRPHNVVINNTTIINKTVNITNTTVINNTVINQGPRVEVVERASGHRVTTVAAATLRHTQEAPVVAQHPNLSQDHRNAPAQRNVPERSLQNQSNSTPAPSAAPRPLQATPASPAPTVAPDHRNAPAVSNQNAPVPQHAEAKPAPVKHKRHEKQPKKDERQPVPPAPAPSPAPAP